MSDVSVRKELELEIKELESEVETLIQDEYTLIKLLLEGDDVGFITSSYMNLESNIETIKTRIRTLKSYK